MPIKRNAAGRRQHPVTSWNELAARAEDLIRPWDPAKKDSQASNAEDLIRPWDPAKKDSPASDAENLIRPWEPATMAHTSELAQQETNRVAIDVYRKDGAWRVRVLRPKGSQGNWCAGSLEGLDPAATYNVASVIVEQGSQRVEQNRLVRDYGKRAFDFLFPEGDGQSWFSDTVAKARLVPLHLRLFLPLELDYIMFEYMAQEESNSFAFLLGPQANLCMSLVRGLRRVEAEPSSPRLSGLRRRIFFAYWDQSNQEDPKLNLDLIKALFNVVENCGAADLLPLNPRNHLRLLADSLGKIKERCWLQVWAHGDMDHSYHSCIYMADANGLPERLYPLHLIGALKGMFDKIPFVLLGCSHSRDFAYTLVSQGFGSTVAYQNSVVLKDAETVAQCLLDSGESVEEGLAAARREIFLDGGDWGCARLYMNEETLRSMSDA